jgi:hypothetical protein
MVAGGMLEQDDDIFFLHRYEVYSLLYEVEAAWAVGVGRARVVHRVEELEELVDGEILVCPVTAPS